MKITMLFLGILLICSICSIAWGDIVGGNNGTAISFAVPSGGGLNPYFENVDYTGFEVYKKNLYNRRIILPKIKKINYDRYVDSYRKIMTCL
jgi:hypothetical protein